MEGSRTWTSGTHAGEFCSVPLPGSGCGKAPSRLLPCLKPPSASASPSRCAAGSMFQLIGGTAASVLILGIPGALLIQSSLEEAQGARPSPPSGRAGAPLGALPAAGGAGAGGAAAGAEEERGLRQPLLLLPGQARPLGRPWWGSGVFWAGALLETATVGLWAVTIYNLFLPQQ
jgi:hypothetical protein